VSADLGWADLELLEKIREAGTLSGAARALGVDQTTVSRRLSTLERRVGATLFARVEGRLLPAPPLAAIAERLRAMSEQAAVSTAILRNATVEIRANVRVTSVGFLLAHALAPALDSFEREHPRVCVEFVADDRALSFERREADVAVRLGRSAEDSTRVRKLEEIGFRLCRPAGLAAENTRELPVVRYGDDLRETPEMRALDGARPDARVAFKSNRLDILIEAALALGAEIMLPEAIAERDPRFAVVLESGASAARPMFLMIHPDRVGTPSVAAVASWVGASLQRWARV
jgi:DNA-binding transcriptional LysR family regulator